MESKNAIVLCSGGIDSVVTAFFVKKKLNYKNLIFLFFDYGQKTREQEEYFSLKNAKKLNARFEKIELGWLGGISNSLINKEGEIKELKKEELKNTKNEAEKWYVPCRNTMFMVYALALAESILISEKKVYDIFVGFKCEGKEYYPDTTKEFLVKMNEMQESSTQYGKFRFLAPLIDKDKNDVVLIGNELEVNFMETYSCYVGGKIDKMKHCGTCLNCRLRQQGFYWANLKDETEYEKN